MSRAVAITVAGVVGAVLVGRLASKAGPVDWAERIQAMPDSAPPKWMYTTLSATRENTEKILRLLQAG